MKCDAYKRIGKNAYCFAEKNCPECRCGGDTKRCDFYGREEPEPEKDEYSGLPRLRVKLDKHGIMPTRAHKTDAGLDLYSPQEVIIPAGGSAVIDTGVHVELPISTAGMLKSKSGLNVNCGIVSEGVIDVGYTGSIKVKLYNHSRYDYMVRAGDKITQLVIVPCACMDVELVDSISGGERGSSGFGSTGR